MQYIATLGEVYAKKRQKVEMEGSDVDDDEEEPIYSSDVEI